MNKHHFRKLATIGATGALALQLFAGTTAAAVPNAGSDGFAYGDFAGDGWAGFSMSYSYDDSSTLAKLYLEIDISGATAVKQFELTRGSTAIRGCSVSASVIKCEIRTVRSGDDFSATLVVEPSDTADEVRLEGGWSSTGYVPGGNNSHGDAWDLCVVAAGDLYDGCDVDDDATTTNDLVSSRTGDGNVAAGFGNSSLNTSTTDLGGNRQAASLKSLPNGKYAYVNDNAGDGGEFPLVDISVNDGDPAPFQLVIVYPKGTGSPKSFEHVSEGYDPATYLACQKGKTKVDCFEWSNKNSTVTLFLSHNGQLRRSG